MLVRTRGEKLSRIEFTTLQAGNLAVRGESRGFLLSGVPGVPDTPITRGGLGGALDGDFVLVRLEKPPARGKGKGDTKAPGKGPARRGFRQPREMGIVVKVLVSRRNTVVGLIQRKSFWSG